MVVWATLALTTISFCGSALLRKNLKNDGGMRFRYVIYELSSRRLSLVMLAMFAIASVAFIYNEFISNPVGIPLITYIADPEISRDPNWQWKWGSFWMLSIPVFAFTALLYLKARTEKRFTKKGLLLVGASFYPVMELLKMSRSDCIYGLTCILFAEYYYRKSLRQSGKKKKTSLRRILQGSAVVALIGGAALVSASVFSEIRGSKPMSAYAEKLGMSVELPDPYASVVVETYGYLALPFENFSNFVNSYPGRENLGVGVLRPIYTALGLGAIPRSELQDIDFDKYLEMLPINTYPFLATIYAESGWIGIMLAPIFYALMINYLYLRFRLAPSITSFSLYSIMASYCWLWMFCNQNFTGLQYYLYALCAPILIAGMSMLERSLSKYAAQRMPTQPG
jgi:hypothetical protein